MGRWRDAKQGKKSKPNVEQESIQPILEPCASLPDRFKAFLTDSFLITTPIFYIVMYLIMGGGESFSQNRGIGWGLILILHFSIILFFWLKSGQTFGLKSYSLKLVNVSTKRKVSVIQAVIRYIATLFCIITLFLMFLPLFRKDKRTFQDLFSNSYIIKE